MIDVFVADEQSDEPVDANRWAELARRVVAAQGLREEAELSVLFVDEETMAAHNRQFLGHEGPTDVLSFPIEDELVLSGRVPDNGGTGPTSLEREPEAPLLLGDVLICPAVAARQAKEHAGTYDREIALLLVHGILHLFGMDHELDEQAEEMEAREMELLAAFEKDQGAAELAEPQDQGR